MKFLIIGVCILMQIAYCHCEDTVGKLLTNPQKNAETMPEVAVPVPVPGLEGRFGYVYASNDRNYKPNGRSTKSHSSGPNQFMSDDHHGEHHNYNKHNVRQNRHSFDHHYHHHHQHQQHDEYDYYGQPDQHYCDDHHHGHHRHDKYGDYDYKRPYHRHDHHDYDQYY